MKGTVIKLLGKACTILADPPSNEHYECYLRGRLFEKGGVQCAVGDRVEFDSVEEFHHAGSSGGKNRLTGVIHQILPRRSALSRPAKRRDRKPQVIAANVDQLVVVSALKNPRFKIGLIDRYLVIAHRAGIAAALCLNKTDLGKPNEISKARAEHRPYQDIGCPLILTSALTGDGCEDLKSLLKDKRSVLAGHSGVGKSKLAGQMKPGLTLPSSEVRRSGKGRHTTSVSTLITLDFGGELVDTPGVRELGVNDVGRKELAYHFLDFEPFLDGCRFKSCSHITEPECAVKDAVEAGKIHRARHDSYAKLYRELSLTR